MIKRLKSRCLKYLLRFSYFCYNLSEIVNRIVWDRQAHLLEGSLKVAFLFQCDATRFSSYSWHEAKGVYQGNIAEPRFRENLSAIITMEYHRLEKCLVMPDRNDAAGQEAAKRLVSALEKQISVDGPTEEGAFSVKVLDVYFSECSHSMLHAETLRAKSRFCEIRRKYECSSRGLSEHGGFKIVAKSEIDDLGGEKAVQFIRSRHSVRDFEQSEIPKDFIFKVVDDAMTAPSVCNRQAWHVYATTNRSTIEGCLKFQNGNKGFTHRIPLLFVITMDLRRFVSPEERNQAWIDGGLFSMTLMLAIHAKSYGACALNWSASRTNDDGLRRFIGIPEHEVVIMLLAAGRLKETTRVAYSPRRESRDIVRIIDSNAGL